MMSLWVGASLLSVIALVFLFWPLLRQRKEATTVALATEVNARLEENIRLFREHIAELDVQLADGRIDQIQYDQLKLEQERTLLDDEATVRAALPANNNGKFGIKTFAVVAVLAIVSAWGLYHHLGSSADVEVRQAQELKQQLDAEDIKAGRNPDPVRTREVNRLIEARLADIPDHLQYWFFLARNYMELNEFDKAVNAYQQVLQRDKESAMVMAELAQAMFLREGRQTNPEINDLVAKVLKAEPDNTMALGLAGINAFSKKDYVNAMKHWERVVKLVGEDTPTGQSLSAGIERAATLYFAEGGSVENLERARNGRQIGIHVSLADGVKAQPDQVVFVYARAYQGAKMPLAIDRVKVADLPRVVLLNESMAMTPAMSLGSFDEVEVVARISNDGTATAKPGDWEGSLGPVDLTTSGPVVNVTIDRQVK
ncbi:MAG: c-type cytochrome biogenesis protein CcmI [Cellvibrio sp. 79]|nr:MAG: c-type cytochrome biogenesis protein CcmI [Cellvibrio sp. 79]